MSTQAQAELSARSTPAQPQPPDDVTRRVFTRRHALACLAAGQAAAWPMGAQAWSLGDLWPAVGSGRVTVVQQTMPEPIHGVAVHDAMVVELRQDQSQSVAVEVDDNLQALVDLQLVDGVLQVRQTRPFKATRLRVQVPVWRLRQLSVAGSGLLQATGLVAEKLQIAGAGAGRVRLNDLTAETLRVQAGGSALVGLTGRCNDLNVSLGGSAVFDGEDLAVLRVVAALGGAAQARVWAQQRLSGGVAGASMLRYRGSPETTVSTGGAAHVARL